MSRAQRVLDSPENVDLYQQKKNKRGLHHAEKERTPPPKQIKNKKKTQKTYQGPCIKQIKHN